MSTNSVLSRRSFAAGCAAAATIAPVLLPVSMTAIGITATEAHSDESVAAAPTAVPTTSTPASVPAGDTLQSEFLFDLILERGTANNIGSPGVTRVIVPVSAGVFEGPKLKGAVVGPSGDWIVARPDGVEHSRPSCCVSDRRRPEDLHELSRHRLYPSRWVTFRTHRAGVRDKRAQVRVAEQRCRGRSVSPDAGKSRIPRLPDSLTVGSTFSHGRCRLKTLQHPRYARR